MWVVLILFSSPSEACFPLPPILWRWISWFSQLATRTCSHMTLECLHFCSAQVIPIKIKWSLKCKLWRVCVWKFLSVAIPAERLEACQPAVFPLRGTVAYTVIVYIGLLHKCNMEILFLQWYYNISLAFTCFFFLLEYIHLEFLGIWNFITLILCIAHYVVYVLWLKSTWSVVNSN